jgi:hypothetical protein
MSLEREISQFLQRVLSDNNIQVDVRVLNDMTKKTKIFIEEINKIKKAKKV